MKPNFIIAVTGQSNSQGVGGIYECSKTEDQPHERVLGYNAKLKQWTTASMYDESLGTSDHKYIGTQSFAFHFAKQIAKNDPSKIIGIINYGIGGQPIKRWNKIPSQCLFTFIKNAWNCDTISIKGVNDKILCVDNEYDVHCTRPVNVNFGWESFNVINVDTNLPLSIEDIQQKRNNTVCLKSVFHEKFINISESSVVCEDVCKTMYIIENINYGYNTLSAFKIKGTNNYLGLNEYMYIPGNIFGYSKEYTKLVSVNSENHNDIYTTHVQRVRDALEDADLKYINCLCWHQGEADYYTYGTYYEYSLYQTIIQYRNESFCNKDTPFIVGNTCVILNSEEDVWASKNKQLFKLNIDSLNNTACVNSIGVDYNLDDPIHFSSEGHRQLGYLYAEKYYNMTLKL